MTLSKFITPEAERNIEDIGDYLEERNPSVARRFTRSVGETIEMLLRNPNLGERLHTDLLGQIRYRTVIDFKNYLIFYRQVGDVLEIIRVLHGASDYEKFFD